MRRTSCQKIDVMDRLSWIMSEGGPLICLEAKFAPSWGGVFRLTVSKTGAKNDYERPDNRLYFLQSIPLQVGKALIFGEGPLDTAFWHSDNDRLFIARIYYCEPDVDVDVIMRAVDESIFENPRESLEFYFGSSELIMFDSAEEGDEPDKKSVTASIEPGRYEILTQTYEPDELTALVLHRFDRIA